MLIIKLLLANSSSFVKVLGLGILGVYSAKFSLFTLLALWALNTEIDVVLPYYCILDRYKVTCCIGVRGG